MVVHTDTLDDALKHVDFRDDLLYCGAGTVEDKFNELYVYIPDHRLPVGASGPMDPVEYATQVVYGVAGDFKITNVLHLRSACLTIVIFDHSDI